jgi:hypothetical protein
VRESEATLYGWKLLVLMEALTRIPLAAKGVKIPAPAGPRLCGAREAGHGGDG